MKILTLVMIQSIFGWITAIERTQTSKNLWTNMATCLRPQSIVLG